MENAEAEVRYATMNYVTGADGELRAYPKGVAVRDGDGR